MGSGARSVVAAGLAFALHLPFVLRYDLHFQPDFAISALMSRAIAFEGERPIFFWGQSYLGSYGCHVTGLLFRLFGYSLPLAGLVSLAVFAAGVGLATSLAERLLGARGAWWTLAAAATASPYANHYVTQAYSSYETAPVLAVLAITALGWSGRLVARPLGATVAAAWLGIGLLAGFAWWTTRLVTPTVIAVGVAAVLTARWRLDAVRRAARGLALVAAGALVGASPEIAFRLGGGEAAASEGTALMAFAAPDAIPENVVNGLRALPAYLNGDPRARLPEGVVFAERIAAGLEPAAPPPRGVPQAALDGLVAVVSGVVLLVALAGALRALRERNAPLLALCLAPFVHLALIGVSAQAGGGYYHARRYWFGALLILPLLFAHAAVLGERARTAVLRHGTRALALLVLVSSLVAQARLLFHPDELAPYRLLAQDLVAQGERALFMPTWSSWVVAALAGGRLDNANTHYNHRPVLERTASADRIAFARPADEGFPGGIGVGGVVFVRGSDPPRHVGRWHWKRYVPAPAD